jgi:CBS domain containing-hemolysin-like protein
MSCSLSTLPINLTHSRKQLKALVTLHAKDEGFGGRLTGDEIQIITGALDLTRKTAYHAMTPLDKVCTLPYLRPMSPVIAESDELTVNSHATTSFQCNE